jgi:hypothetical protein
VPGASGIEGIYISARGAYHAHALRGGTAGWSGTGGRQHPAPSLCGSGRAVVGVITAHRATLLLAADAKALIAKAHHALERLTSLTTKGIDCAFGRS